VKLKSNKNAGMQANKFQKGFIAAEVAISITIGMAVLAYAGNVYYKYKVNERDDESALRVADYLNAISGSLATYTSDNNTQIQSNAAIGTIPGSRVQNPTLQDLVNVANLNSRYLTPVTYKGATIDFVPSVVVNNTNGCTVPNCMLTYGVRTTNFLPSQKDATVPDIGRTSMVAAKVSSTRAGVSLPSSLGNPAQFVASGGVLVAANPTSQPGLIYAENVFDTQMLRPFLRRDGSLPMTGDLNMQDTGGVRHSINNAEVVNAQKVSSVDVNATNLKATQTDTVNINATNGQIKKIQSDEVNTAVLYSTGTLYAQGNGITATNIASPKGSIDTLTSSTIKTTYADGVQASFDRMYSNYSSITQLYSPNGQIVKLNSADITSTGNITAYNGLIIETARTEGSACSVEGMIGKGYSWGSAPILTCRSGKWEGIKATMDIIQGGGYISGLKPGKRYVVSINGITGHRGNDGAWLTAVRLTDSSGNLIAQAHDPVYINWHDGSAPHSGTVAVYAPADGVIYGYTDAGGAYSMVAMGGF
jgi:hypothetical protein